MTEVLEFAITYPETEMRCSAVIRQIDGRYWGEVTNTQRLGIEMVDADSRGQALMISLALCGVTATVHDVEMPGLNRGGA